jgi:2,3-bisphosphoglycerate-independent phosphoglycerate mutase
MLGHISPKTALTDLSTRAATVLDTTVKQLVVQPNQWSELSLVGIYGRDATQCRSQLEAETTAVKQDDVVSRWSIRAFCFTTDVLLYNFRLTTISRKSKRQVQDTIA